MKNIEISLEKMVVDTYRKIAIWHNEDTTKEGLKVISYEIVEDILNYTFEQMDVKTKAGISEGVLKEAIEKINSIKDKKEETPKEEKKDKNGIFNKIF